MNTLSLPSLAVRFLQHSSDLVKGLDGKVETKKDSKSF